VEGDEDLQDYFEGQLKQYRIEDVNKIAFRRNENKLIPIIPKKTPTQEPILTY
jgi:hypothetical protein